MKTKRILATTLLMLFSIAFTLSQEKPMPRPEGAGPDMRMMEQLKLTDEQRNQIQKLQTDFMKQQITQRGRLQTSRLELRELMRADNPDKAAIEKKINEVSQLSAQMRVAGVNQMLSVRKVLTPEQQKMIRGALNKRFQGGFMGPHQRMRGFAGPRFGRRFEGRMRRFGGPDSGGQDFRPRRPF